MIGSREVASAAIALAITKDRDDERNLRRQLDAQAIKSAAVDFGGEFLTSIHKMIEHIVVAARREGVIADSNIEEGAVAGAAREALSQIINKAIGLNVGGKISITRHGEHIGVCMFYGIGLLHLNEVAVGLGHRVI